MKLALIAACAASLCAGAAHAADFTCEGKTFTFFPGGSEGDSFASIVYNGAKLAAEQTGCNVDYVWSNWDPQKMVQQFSEAIARKPAGIAIMGHPGDEALDPLIDQARKAGIVVTVSNVALPTAEKKYKSEGLGFVGPEALQSGRTLGEAAVSTCGLKSGDKAFVWGLLGQAGRGKRTQGVLDALKDAGVETEYLEISDAVNGDAAQGIPIFASFAASHPDLKAVITDHGALTATIPAYMKAAGKKPGEICGAGFDLSSAIVSGLKDGSISVVLDQQPFLQGYLAIVQLYMTSKFGFAGLHVDTGAALITKDNVDVLAPLAAEAIR
jgi:simple sugar transport system substrate-binding protein